jgi:hypothetical protein
MIDYNLILYAFEEDDEISKYCDPEDEHKSIKNLVDSIYEKLLDYNQFGNCSFNELKIGNEVIGFYFCYKNILVSFGINKNHRTKEKLIEVFNIIKDKFGGEFESYMWERNERAINWLKKCGMEEEEFKVDKVKKLKYTLCQ